MVDWSKSHVLVIKQQSTPCTAEKMKELLEEGNLVSSHDWSETEWESVLEAQLITSKPILFVCNVDEDGLDEDNEFVDAVRSHANKLGNGVVKVCAQAG